MLSIVLLSGASAALAAPIADWIPMVPSPSEASPSLGDPSTPSSPQSSTGLFSPSLPAPSLFNDFAQVSSASLAPPPAYSPDPYGLIFSVVDPVNPAKTQLSIVGSQTKSSPPTRTDVPFASTSTVFSTVTVAVTASPVIVVVTSTLGLEQFPTSLSSSTLVSSSMANIPPSSSVPQSSPSPVASSVPPRPPAFKGPVMATYYPDWASDSLPPEKVDFDRYDWADFAFAIPNASFNLTFDQDNSPDLLTRLVTHAHVAHKRVKLSVGGWTGSMYFSSAVSTPENRQVFISNIVNAYDRFNLDGIDIDWEYPGTQGAGGNKVSPSDSANYLLFLTSLRSALPPTALITAAVATAPFASPSGSPLASVSSFSDVLDYILLMNYDVWGASDSAPGPNAPLSNACGNSTQPSGSAMGAIDAWSKAGFDKSKMILGIPSYGYVQNSKATKLMQRSAPGGSSVVPGLVRTPSRPGSRASALDHEDRHSSKLHRRRHSRVSSGRKSKRLNSERTSTTADVTPTPSTQNNIRVTGVEDSQIQFNELVRQNVLQPSLKGDGTETTPIAELSLSALTTLGTVLPNASWVGAGGFERFWDACSSTPFLMSSSQGQLITYDDPMSLEMKATSVKKAGLAGVNMFDVHGDTPDYVLTDAARRGLGLPKAGTSGLPSGALTNNAP